MQIYLRKKSFIISYFDIENQPKSKKVEFDQPSKKDCISGYEDLTRFENRKVKQQFRFNRIRSVPNDTPSHGRLPVSQIK